MDSRVAKGADCKSVGNAFEGSNPSPSTVRKKQIFWFKTKTVRILLYPLIESNLVNASHQAPHELSANLVE